MSGILSPKILGWSSVIKLLLMKEDVHICFLLKARIFRLHLKLEESLQALLLDTSLVVSRVLLKEKAKTLLSSSLSL